MAYIDHMIATMQAAKEGKAIQSRRVLEIDACWGDAPWPSWGDAPWPSWDWATFDYRVKPAEPRRVWLNWYPTKKCRSSVCYDSREEAAKFACYEASQQIEFVEVME